MIFLKVLGLSSSILTIFKNMDKWHSTKSEIKDTEKTHKTINKFTEKKILGQHRVSKLDQISGLFGNWRFSATQILAEKQQYTKKFQTMVSLRLHAQVNGGYLSIKHCTDRQGQKYSPLQVEINYLLIVRRKRQISISADYY